MHGFERPRFPIDDFERLVIKVFSEFGSLEAIWIREVPNVEDQTKASMRIIWLQFARLAKGEMARVQTLVTEMTVRYFEARFGLEFRCLIDEPPNSGLGAACVYRRGEQPRGFK